MTTLITGANGFIGSALAKRLLSEGISVRSAVRAMKTKKETSETVEVGNISSETDWSKALGTVQQVVHLAARVHVMDDISLDPLNDFRLVNVGGTINLAKQAAAAGVKRFIYLSSIKVNGESTELNSPFTVQDVPSPTDPYGTSKLEAEHALKKVAAETGMEIVIIRPPLVYGPGVRANFFSLMSWVKQGLPFPFAAITNNRRSFVSLDNLIDFILTCLIHPKAANQMFLVSDGEDLSTVDLLTRIGTALEKPARLFFVPDSFLKLSAKILKKESVYQRLCGSLQLDIHHTCEFLKWTPPISVDEGLRRTSQGLLK